MSKRTKKSQTDVASFDYAKFESDAIAKLRAGGSLIGTEGIFKELIHRIVSAALQGIVGNRKNGYTSKILRTSLGEVPITPPRDRLGSFTPELVGKWDRNLNTGLEAQILELYSLGNGVLEIQSHVQKMYGASLSTGQISAVTEQACAHGENFLTLCSR